MLARIRSEHILVLCLLLLIAGLVFWPGLYRYEQLRESTPGLGTFVTLVRIHRLTGASERYDKQQGRWLLPTPAPDKPTIQAVPSEERTKVSGQASLNDGVFRGEIYNGSGCTLTRSVESLAAEVKEV